MERKWDKDLTIMVTGLGTTTAANLRENLEDWIFGTLDEREVKIIVPVLTKMGPGIKELFVWGSKMGFDFTIIQTEGAPMTREITSLPQESFTRVKDDQQALHDAFALLDDAHVAGHETAFIMLYDPKSVYKHGEQHVSDREIISTAKGSSYLTTLNLSQGLLDSFEGYESDADRKAREVKEADWDREQKRINALAVESGVAPKKAVAPRKRAAKKAVAPTPVPAPVEPEKAVQEPSGLDKLIAKAVANDKAQLSLQDELAKAAPKPVESLLVKKADLAELGNAIRTMGEAFSSVMATFTRILEEN